MSATHSKMAGGNDTNRHVHSCPHGHNLTNSQGDQTQRSRSHCYHISQLMCLIIPCCVAKSDFLASVALRPRQSPYPLLPVDQALQIVLQHTSVLPAVEITNTIGRTYIPDT